MKGNRNRSNTTAQRRHKITAATVAFIPSDGSVSGYAKTVARRRDEGVTG